MHERFERKRTMGFRFADGDPLWTLANVRLYALIALVAGLFPVPHEGMRRHVHVSEPASPCACVHVHVQA